MHILDQVLSERTIVSWNDKALRDEEEEEENQGQTKVTLDNVFELAKEDQEDDSENEDSSEEEGGEDKKTKKKMRSSEVIEDSELLKSVNPSEYNRPGQTR